MRLSTQHFRYHDEKLYCVAGVEGPYTIVVAGQTIEMSRQNSGPIEVERVDGVLHVLDWPKKIRSPERLPRTSLGILGYEECTLSPKAEAAMKLRFGPTVADRILAAVKGRPWMTAQEIRNDLGPVPSLGSTLTKLTREGKLVRRDNCGPQGGYGYALPGEGHDAYRVKGSETKALPTCWDHLDDD